MGFRIGIDAGSKTIKVVVLDGRGEIVRSVYRRHLANIKTTLSLILREMVDEGGDVSGPVAFTGSAGIALAESLGAPHIQEVVATTAAVRDAFPHADAFIELGGEDAKIVYLSDGLEQRMNATCAGGTGGFIDTMAGMLGVRSSGMNRLAWRARRIYPIASRCAVFAQTDVRPLLNAGADPQDIAASVLDAVARQTLGGLACGRPLKGTVVFLGGPLEHIPTLVERFRIRLGLTEETGIKPYQAHLLTARGAALHASEQGFRTSLSELARACEGIALSDDGLARLDPLFADARDIRAFKRRHAACRWPRVPLRQCAGPLFLGFDAGSTTVKLVLLDEDGNLVHSEYRSTRGDTFSIASAMLAHVWDSLPDGARIARAAVTGYGEDLLRAGLGVDEGVVETLAHAQAACAMRPDASFVLDIGGQDMKALWVRDGAVVDAVLNEACSSGCGAFLEGTAYALGSTPDALADAALRATSPVDLGTKCTVFMSSRVKHAQKIGAALPDLGAGLAYSVVKNALYRIIGADRASSMGGCVMVQGGAFKSDAVTRAFELVCGREVIRPDVAHLMGAIGAALVAARRWRELRSRDGSEVLSGLADAYALRRINPVRTMTRCDGCANACLLTIVEFGPGKRSVSGNRCSRGARRAVDPQSCHAMAADVPALRPPNLAQLEQGLLSAYSNTSPDDLTAPRIGLVTALAGFESLPFWHTLLAGLGFGVTVPAALDDERQSSVALESIPSESVCYPAKQAHPQLFSLARCGVDAVFMPRFERGRRCPVLAGYVDALRGAEDDAEDLSIAGVPLLSPRLSSPYPARARWSAVERDGLIEALQGVGGRRRAIAPDKFAAAWEAAVAAQRRFERTLSDGAEAVARWLDADRRRCAALLACRPYHIDPQVLHGIDGMLTRLGFAVLTPLAIEALARIAPDHPLVVARREDAGEPRAAWSGSKRLVGLARIVAAHPQLHAVFLRSFGCVMDAVGLEEARGVLEASGKPFAVVKIDDIVDISHVGIRLRTLAETVAIRRPAGDGVAAARTGGHPPRVCQRSASIAGAAAFDGDGRGGDQRPAVVEVLGEPFGSDEIETARRDVPADLCFTAAMLASRAIRRVRGLGDGGRPVILRLPKVCRSCMLGALPLIVGTACGCACSVEWTAAWPERAPSSRRAKGDRCRDGERPRIGIVGNALLCFEPALNGNAGAVLKSCGCEPVFADPSLLLEDDIRYIAQLDRWYAEGIRDVVYLLGFGCLKGHVSVRGSLRRLARRYPGMRITVIDCDAEASDLNRENRLRLAAVAALEAAAQERA